MHDVRRAVLILFFFLILSSSVSALTITGFKIEKTAHEVFDYPVTIETEKDSRIILEPQGYGFTIDKSHLMTSANEPISLIVHVSPPAQGWIKVTALDKEEGEGQVLYGVAGYILICVNEPCPVIPRKTPKPTIEPTIRPLELTTTDPTIDPTIEPTTIDPIITPVEEWTEEHNRDFTGAAIALFIGVAVSMGLIVYIKERKKERKER